MEKSETYGSNLSKKKLLSAIVERELRSEKINNISKFYSLKYSTTKILVDDRFDRAIVEESLTSPVKINRH